MNKELLKHILDLKKEHPFWGYRRCWAWLRFRLGYEVNQKRIYRLMKMNRLMCPVNHKLKAKRTPIRSKPKANRPNQFWGIDMTKVLLPHTGWAYLQVVLDWYSKKIVGWTITPTSKTQDWLDALEMAVLEQFPDGVRDKELRLISDNGCQPTSKAFGKHCDLLDIEQIFTSYNNPKGNADTERVIRTIKEDLVYINEFMDRKEFRDAFQKWVDKYNFEYPHSALKYLTPYQA